MMNWDDFCLVGLLEEKNDRKGLVYSGQEEDQLLFTCWPEDTYPSEEVRTSFLKAFMKIIKNPHNHLQIYYRLLSS